MYINVYIYFLDICLFVIYIRKYIKKIYVKYIYIYTQSILVFDTMQVLYWPVLGLIQFCSFDRGCKTCLDTKLVLIPLQNWLCACSKTSFVPSLNLLHQNRLCACSEAGFASALNLPFPFTINISTVSEVRFDCQGLGLVARNEASILVFDTKPVLYRPVLDQIQFWSFDRGCKTCLDTKPVLNQGRFCSLAPRRLAVPQLRKWRAGSAARHDRRSVAGYSRREREFA